MPRFRRQRGILCLTQDVQVDAEAGIRRFGPGDRLEHQIDRSATADDLQRVGDMRQYAGLGRDVMTQTQRLQHVQQGDAVGDAVGGRIDADHGIAATQQKPVDRCRADPAQVIGRMVRLQAGAQPPWQTLGIAERGGDPAATGDADQILVAHQLGCRCRHLRRDGRRKRGQPVRGCFIGQQPVAKAADGQMGRLLRNAAHRGCRGSAG